MQLRRRRVCKTTVGLLAAVGIMGAVGAARAGQPVPADSLIAAAEKKAAASHKNVLLMFHASWCGWCHRLEAVLHKPEYHKLIDDNYVIVPLDVMERGDKKEQLENPGAQKLLEDFGGAQSGIPFYVFLSPNGKKLADSNVMPRHSNIGCPGSPEEIAAFDSLLQQTAPNMRNDEREGLSAYLKANAPH